MFSEQILVCWEIDVLLCNCCVQSRTEVIVFLTAGAPDTENSSRRLNEPSHQSVLHCSSGKYTPLGFDLQRPLNRLSKSLCCSTHTPHPGYTVLPELIDDVAALLGKLLDGHTERETHSQCKHLLVRHLNMLMVSHNWHYSYHTAIKANYIRPPHDQTCRNQSPPVLF